MRYFKSLGSDGWKSAVLKIKMRKKLPAITITLTAVSIFCFLVLAEAFFMMTSGSFNALAAQRTASQAEQNARIEVKRLENLDYAELSYLAEHPRQVMEGVEDGNWESEVTLGPEKNLSEDDNVKIRLAHVSIYRTQDSVSRYDVDVPLTSATGTTPIGSVMTWTSEGKPTTGGVWLECNGQTIPSKYKRLRELIGNKTPDYRGMFLRGYGSQTVNAYQGVMNGYSNQTYHSGGLGKVQTDQNRDMIAHVGGAAFIDYVDLSYFRNALNYPAPFTDGYNQWYSGGYGGGSGPAWKIPYRNGSLTGESGGFFTNAKNPSHYWQKMWVMTKPPHKYSLSGGGCSGHGDGGFYCPPPTLSEYDDNESGEWHEVAVTAAAIYNAGSMPTGTEIQPVNIAVRYFIKAR